jgi:hypothetical protein
MSAVASDEAFPLVLEPEMDQDMLDERHQVASLVAVMLAETPHQKQGVSRIRQRAHIWLISISQRHC